MVICIVIRKNRQRRQQTTVKLFVCQMNHRPADIKFPSYEIDFAITSWISLCLTTKITSQQCPSGNLASLHYRNISAVTVCVMVFWRDVNLTFLSQQALFLNQSIPITSTSESLSLCWGSIVQTFDNMLPRFILFWVVGVLVAAAVFSPCFSACTALTYRLTEMLPLQAPIKLAL